MSARVMVVPLVVCMFGAAACNRGRAPKMQVLSESAAKKLWSEVKSYEPVGEAVTNRRKEGNLLLSTCSRTYSARMPDGTGVGITIRCLSGCELLAGPNDCIIVGCDPVGPSCTPMTCVGSCKPLIPCHDPPETVVTSFGGIE